MSPPATPSPETAEFLARLVSLMSHELRTPLAVIVGYAEVLGLRDDKRTRREAAARIREAADRLSRMIDDVLATAALDTGSALAYPEPLELRPAIEAAAARLGASGELGSFAARCPDEAVVRADGDHLRQILTNLLSVACGGTGRPVEAEASESDGFALVSIRGDGPVPGEERRAASLALDVARRLAELNGGTLEAGEDPEGGATFRLAVPLPGSRGGG